MGLWATLDRDVEQDPGACGPHSDVWAGAWGEAIADVKASQLPACS